MLIENGESILMRNAITIIEREMVMARG